MSRERAQLDYPYADGPAAGTTREIAPGLRWVRMPVPFPPEHINLWMIEDGEGWAIVDCGLGLDETRRAWEQIEAHNPDLWSEFKSNDVDAQIDELVRFKHQNYPDDQRRILTCGIPKARLETYVARLQQAGKEVHIG